MTTAQPIPTTVPAGDAQPLPLAAAPPADVVARDPHWADKMARLRNRKPTQRSITVPLDPEALHALEDAKAALVRAYQDAGDDEPSETVLEPLRTAVDVAQALVDETTERLTFRRLPDDVYERLIAEHQPGDDDKAKGFTYNRLTFPPALMAACSIDGMPVEDATELLTAMSNGEAEFVLGLLVALNRSIALQVETR